MRGEGARIGDVRGEREECREGYRGEGVVVSVANATCWGLFWVVTMQ